MRLAGRRLGRVGLRRGVLILVLASGSLALPVRPSLACSIASLPDPRAHLVEADGAFVGVLVSKTHPSGPIFSSVDPVTMRFVVEWDVKGRLGRTVNVETVASSASCGIGDMVREGERVALVLHGSSHRWTAGLGDLGDPERMLAATKPLIARGGQPAFLATITDGGNRLVAFDRSGRIIAYGEAESLMAFCPGGRRFVTSTLGVRDVRTYEAYSLGVTLPNANLNRRWEVSCRDDRGSEILVISYTSGVKRGQASVFRIRGTKIDKLYDLSATAGVFHPTRDSLFYGGGTWGHELTELDLRTGARRVLARLDADVRNLSLSHDGRHLASASHRNPFVKERSPSPIALVEVVSGRLSQTSVRAGTSGQMLWLDKATVVFAPAYYGWTDTVRVFDTRLRERGRIVPWGYTETLIDGGKLVGFKFPQLVVADLPGGPIRPLAASDRAIEGNLVSVPPGIETIAWPVPETFRLTPVYLGRVGILDTARTKWWPVIRWVLPVAVLFALVVFLLMRTRRRPTVQPPH